MFEIDLEYMSYVFLPQVWVESVMTVDPTPPSSDILILMHLRFYNCTCRVNTVLKPQTFPVALFI